MNEPLLTRFVRAMIWLYFAVLVAGAAAVLAFGLGYYTTPEAERLTHPLHDVLRPGATGGLWLGVLGTSLMLAMLSYSVRKLLLRWTFLGSPAHWLHFHIICGIMGPTFILLHTSFQVPDGLIGIGFWCMVLVALSGSFGRYVYGHFPRTAAGRSQDLEEAREALVQLRADVVAASPGASGESIGAAVALARDLDQQAHTIRQWLALDIEVRRRRDLIPVHLARAGLPPQAQRQVGHRLTEQLLAKRDLEAWSVTAKLFQWWHLFHEPLAKAMYIIVTLHILEAFVFGGAMQRLFP